MQKVALCIQGLGHVSIRSVLRGCNATGGVLFDYFVEFDFHPVLEVRPRRLPGKTISLAGRVRPSRVAGISAGTRAVRRPGSCRYGRKEWPVNWLCPDRGREYILDRAWGWVLSVTWGDCGGGQYTECKGRLVLSKSHSELHLCSSVPCLWAGGSYSNSADFPIISMNRTIHSNPLISVSRKG